MLGQRKAAHAARGQRADAERQDHRSHRRTTRRSAEQDRQHAGEQGTHHDSERDAATRGHHFAWTPHDPMLEAKRLASRCTG